MMFLKNIEGRTIKMNQRSYIKKNLKHLNIEEFKLVKISFNANSKLLKLFDEEFRNA